MATKVAAPVAPSAVLARPALVMLIAILLGETPVNFIDREVLSVLAIRESAAWPAFAKTAALWVPATSWRITYEFYEASK